MSRQHPLVHRCVCGQCVLAFRMRLHELAHWMQRVRFKRKIGCRIRRVLCALRSKHYLFARCYAFPIQRPPVILLGYRCNFFRMRVFPLCVYLVSFFCDDGVLFAGFLLQVCVLLMYNAAIQSGHGGLWESSIRALLFAFYSSHVVLFMVDGNKHPATSLLRDLSVISRPIPQLNAWLHDKVDVPCVSIVHYNSEPLPSKAEAGIAMVGNPVYEGQRPFAGLPAPAIAQSNPVPQLQPVPQQQKILSRPSTTATKEIALQFGVKRLENDYRGLLKNMRQSKQYRFCFDPNNVAFCLPRKGTFSEMFDDSSGQIMKFLDEQFVYFRKHAAHRKGAEFPTGVEWFARSKELCKACFADLDVAELLSLFPTNSLSRARCAAAFQTARIELMNAFAVQATASSTSTKALEAQIECIVRNYHRLACGPERKKFDQMLWSEIQGFAAGRPLIVQQDPQDIEDSGLSDEDESDVLGVASRLQELTVPSEPLEHVAGRPRKNGRAAKSLDMIPESRQSPQPPAPQVRQREFQPNRRGLNGKSRK
eukprot:ANDGO_02328.mRNA.2 hypothetical protein